MRSLLLALLLFGCATEEAVPPDAEVQVTVRPSTSCAPYPLMVASLAAQFGEVAVASGMTRPGMVMEVFSANEGATFSIVYMSLRTGMACLVFHGGDWEFRELERERGPRAWLDIG